MSYYTDKITSNPDWVMADVFADEGKTGTSVKSRKDFQRMIRQCRRGKIDLILTKSLSRFARNTLDTVKYTRELRQLGIPVIFEKENLNSISWESEFLLTLYGAFAQSESESISKNVSWGKRQAMKEGKVTIQYKHLLGYIRGADGKPEIVPDQAEIIRFIFKRYLAGDTLRAIKAQLEAEQVPYITGEVAWNLSTLQSILQNEKYCGDVIMQKTFRKDCISKETVVNTGQLPKYWTQNHHEAIVSREIFDAVQAENELMAKRLQRAAAIMEAAPAEVTEWNESIVHQLVEEVKVLSKDEIKVTFRNGITISQTIPTIRQEAAS